MLHRLSMELCGSLRPQIIRCISIIEFPPQMRISSKIRKHNPERLERRKLGGELSKFIDPRPLRSGREIIEFISEQHIVKQEHKAFPRHMSYYLQQLNSPEIGISLTEREIATLEECVHRYSEDINHLGGLIHTLAQFNKLAGGQSWVIPHLFDKITRKLEGIIDKGDICNIRPKYLAIIYSLLYQIHKYIEITDRQSIPLDNHKLLKRKQIIHTWEAISRLVIKDYNLHKYISDNEHKANLVEIIHPIVLIYGFSDAQSKLWVQGIFKTILSERGYIFQFSTDRFILLLEIYTRKLGVLGNKYVVTMENVIQANMNYYTQIQYEKIIHLFGDVGLGSEKFWAKTLEYFGNNYEYISLENIRATLESFGLYINNTGRSMYYINQDVMTTISLNLPKVLIGLWIADSTHPQFTEHFHTFTSIVAILAEIHIVDISFFTQIITLLSPHIHKITLSHTLPLLSSLLSIQSKHISTQFSTFLIQRITDNIHKFNTSQIIYFGWILCVGEIFDSPIWQKIFPCLQLVLNEIRNMEKITFKNDILERQVLEIIFTLQYNYPEFPTKIDIGDSYTKNLEEFWELIGNKIIQNNKLSETYKSEEFVESIRNQLENKILNQEKVVLEHRIGPYLVDMYCPKNNVSIEISDESCFYPQTSVLLGNFYLLLSNY